jgi:hypothetical protein
VPVSLNLIRNDAVVIFHRGAPAILVFFINVL